MVVGELVDRNNMVKEKIQELEGCICGSMDNTTKQSAINSLFVLIDKHRSYILLLGRSNSNTNVEVAGSSITVSNAVILRACIKVKIDILSDLIEDGTDVINSMDNRDKLYEEHILLNNTIKSSDWSTIID